jgi:hypothetical protein
LSSLTWLAAEALVWTFPQVLGSRLAHSRGPNVRRVFRPDPRWIHGVQGESRYTTNAFGIRGGPLPSSRAVERTLCVGGSTTECAYLDDDETWTHLLMTELAARSGRPAWVGGLGIAGYTTFEHLDFLRSSAMVRGFDRVILLVGINDFVRVLNGSLEMGPPPLWRRSPLLGMALTSLKRRSLHTLLYDAEDPTGANVEARRRIRRQAGTRITPPDLRLALRDYEERIAGLAAACRRRRVRCLFATQPVLWRSDLGPGERDSLWMGSDETGRFYDPGALRHGMDLYNTTLLATCSRLSLDCVDLSAAMSGRGELFYDDCHYTEAGARELAHLLAGHLLAERAEATR